MRQRKQVILAGLLLTAAWMSHASAQRGTAAGATLFEGARLITGDGGAPIENSAFLVENARFTRIGRRGEVQAPAGAARVDLTGKTVIPALVDGHSHIGYMKHLTSGAVNYTRENILDHMYRFAYFGVAASQSMGSDFGELPFQLRDEIIAGKYPDAARFLTAGRGLSPIDEISPDNMRQAANPATTPEGARALVQELVPRRVKVIKTWVDDRGGAVKKLPPEIYRAIFDEAHKNNLRVAVHATALADAKELLRVRHRRLRAHDQRRGRRGRGALQTASERRRAVGARRPASRGVCAVARPGASADPRNGAARTDQPAAGTIPDPGPRTARAVAGRRGIGWPPASSG